MTRTKGSEPKHWHRIGDDGEVHHAMRDPRHYRGYPRRRWTDDERAYVEHLESHERRDNTLRPLDTDPPLVREYLDCIAEEEKQLATLRELVLTLREELAHGMSVAESETASTLENRCRLLSRDAIV